MFPANEFLNQILPLFIQIVIIPTILGIGYYVYQNYYKPRQNKADTLEQSTISEYSTPAYASNIDDQPTLDTIVEFSTSNLITEDESMTENNQPNPKQEKPVSRAKRIDTSELPPLDMLIGQLEDAPVDEPPPPAPVPDAPPQVVQLRTAAVETEHVQLSTGQIAPAQEVITILRDQDDGKLIIQVGNTAYRTLADNSDVKQLFTQVMKELANTITKPDTTPPSRNRYVVGTPSATESKSKPQQPTQPAVQSPESSLRDLLLSDDEPDHFEPTPKPTPKPTRKPSTPPPPQPGGAMPGDLPSFKLEDNPIKAEKKGRFGKQKMEAEPIPELDLAAAIETYLQYKLQHTPDYIGRNIHIHGTPTGSIRIQVDDDYYDFVDEVTDSDVREFLQATIAEWQDRQ